MNIYSWILIISFSVLIASAIFILFRVLFVKSIKDFSAARGNVKSAIVYSFTGAMSPSKKESAYMHFPTYAAGMVYHAGTFICLLWLIFLFFNLQISQWLVNLSILLILFSSLCGIGILIKRMLKPELRALSVPDDYFSSLLVTGFQVCTAIELYSSSILPVLFIYSSFLLLYIPISKLKHSIYFFSSRIFLGRFYGKRGVW